MIKYKAKYDAEYEIENDEWKAIRKEALWKVGDIRTGTELENLFHATPKEILEESFDFDSISRCGSAPYEFEDITWEIIMENFERVEEDNE